MPTFNSVQIFKRSVLTLPQNQIKPMSIIMASSQICLLLQLNRKSWILLQVEQVLVGFMSSYNYSFH